MTIIEKNDSLKQMIEVMTLIDKVQLRDSCTNKEAAQEKLDGWKKDIREGLTEIREKIRDYCKSIERTTDTRNLDKALFFEADSERTVFHNGLITAIDIVVRNIKFNFSSHNFLPVIEARGLNKNAFMTEEEIEKINFLNEDLFLPHELYKGAPLFSANIIKLPENRGKITIWAMAIYNSLTLLEE
ncbi:MAG: hypothetical protein K5829_02525 [Treponema sp.]|nr:hypothetical protein [Treponema sp.]